MAGELSALLGFSLRTVLYSYTRLRGVTDTPKISTRTCNRFLCLRVISVNHLKSWALRRFAYQVYLTNEKKLAPGSIIIAVAALRFLYKVTLQKDWRLEEIIPAPKKRDAQSPQRSRT
jgi:hypothetical protein